MTLFKIVPAALFLGAVALTPAVAQDTMSAEQCQDMMKKADKNSDGSLGQGEMEPFVEKMKGANMKPKNESVVSSDEFMENCQKGTFKDVMMQ
jgi:hypothetical protein